MLFEVRWSQNGKQQKVYSVRWNEKRERTEFLTFREGTCKWEWIPAQECIPIEK